MGHDLVPVEAVIGAGPLIQHPRAVPIRRRRNDTAARAARDHLRPEMIDRHAPARPEDHAPSAIPPRTTVPQTKLNSNRCL